MNLEDDENKRFKDYAIQKVRSIKKSLNAYIVEKSLKNYTILTLGMTVEYSP